MRNIKLAGGKVQPSSAAFVTAVNAAQSDAKTSVDPR
jgi:hypothetical protein